MGICRFFNYARREGEREGLDGGMGRKRENRGPALARPRVYSGLGKLPPCQRIFFCGHRKTRHLP